MISFISNFKKFCLNYARPLKSVCVAFFIILLIELTISQLFKNREILRNVYKENLLNLNFLKEDSASKYTIGYKNYAFFYERPDILIVGDSSGLHGAKPLTLQQHLYGKKIINASCCANSNFDGYLAVANHFLENNQGIKYLMLYVTPYALPAAVQKEYGNNLGSELLGFYSAPWHPIYDLPSLYFRKSIMLKVYRNNLEVTKNSDEVFMNGVARFFTGEDKTYLEFISQTNGWIPMSNVKSEKFATIPLGECGEQLTEYFYDKKGVKPIWTEVLTKFKKLTDQYHAKLIVVFNPVACTASPQVQPMIAEMEKFKKANPDVFIPFDVIHTYDENYFADQNHLNKEGAEKHSYELGEELAKLLAN